MVTKSISPIKRHEIAWLVLFTYLVILILFLFYMLIQLPSLLQSSTNNLHNREWTDSLNCAHKVSGHKRLGLSGHGCFSRNKLYLSMAQATISLSAVKNIIPHINMYSHSLSEIPLLDYLNIFFCRISSCPLDTLCVCHNSLAANHHYTYMTLPSATTTLHHLKGHQLRTL